MRVFLALRMKTIFLFAWCILTAADSFSQPDAVLQKKIDSLFVIDQQVQTDRVLAFQKSAGQKALDSLEAVQMETFARHIPVLKEIIGGKGLPTYKLVGKNSSDNFLTLVNHSFSDIPFQQKVARLAGPEIKNKNISAPFLALMIDKMQIASGKKQHFGTQCDYDEQGNAIAKNLFKPKYVDKRRSKMGLQPLKDYLKMMTELHLQMNKRE
jgi:hypothetical protein